MTVIPLRRRGPNLVHSTGSADSRPDGEPRVPAPGISIPLLGSFRSPSGRTGTMTGSVRLESAGTSADNHLWVQGVFTGELVDADGSHIGVTSRRKVVPARIARDLQGAPTVVGPLQVDLLGLTVSVQAFVVEADPTSA
jgi:hypothetical protein